MTSAPEAPFDLTGMTILIVEDEFYLAAEMQDEIERAGGAVIGPCADVATGLANLERERADYALVDINLGSGPSFEMADALVSADIPFTFLTGYDTDAIPDRFTGVHCLQKPASLSRLLQKLGQARAS